MDVNYAYCPDIWSGGREEIWYGRASEILVKEGLIGGKNPYAEFMGEINQIALGLLYADFCQVAYDESGYYDQVIDSCEFEPTYLAFMIGRYTNDELPEGSNDEYTYRGELLAMLAEEQRPKVVAALKKHWNATEFTVGLYCTVYLPHKFDCDSDEYYDDESNSSEKHPTEQDFCDTYWDFIRNHSSELANEIYEDTNGSAPAAYEWIQNGCETVGTYD